MLKKIQEVLTHRAFHVYDMAILTEKGLQEAVLEPCGRLNNSYSIAKLFINTAIGMLVDEGKLRLEDKITDLLRPQLLFPYDSRWDAVSLRHALSHSMGIDAGCFDVDRDDPATYPTTDYLHYIFAHPPVYLPGTHPLYTDVPHYLLSRVISQITQRPADEMIRERIGIPLQFSPCAWQRCPQGYTIGSSGAFVRAQDLVKLAGLYLNRGEFFGQRFLSESWVKLAEANRWDLYPLRQGDFIGKAGINGQMLVYSRHYNLALAWHGFEPNEKALRNAILEVVPSLVQ